WWQREPSEHTVRDRVSRLGPERDRHVAQVRPLLAYDVHLPETYAELQRAQPALRAFPFLDVFAECLEHELERARFIVLDELAPFRLVEQRPEDRGMIGYLELERLRGLMGGHRPRDDLLGLEMHRIGRERHERRLAPEDELLPRRTDRRLVRAQHPLPLGDHRVRHRAREPRDCYVARRAQTVLNRRPRPEERRARRQARGEHRELAATAS